MFWVKLRWYYYISSLFFYLTGCCSGRRTRSATYNYPTSIPKSSTTKTRKSTADTISNYTRNQPSRSSASAGNTCSGCNKCRNTGCSLIYNRNGSTRLWNSSSICWNWGGTVLSGMQKSVCKQVQPDETS